MFPYKVVLENGCHAEQTIWGQRRDADEATNMALTDDLKDYIARNSSSETKITERHDVAIVGETHAYRNTVGPDIRTRASVRLLLELLGDPKYRYYANEHYHNKGPIRQGVRAYVRNATLPPVYDPAKDASLDLVEIGKRLAVHRYQEVLDFLRIHPRYILSIGTLDDSDASRDSRLAQHFLEEIADRKLHVGIPGVLLVGWAHARAVSDEPWPTVRMLLEKRGFSCVSVRVLTNFTRGTIPDDVVVPMRVGARTRWIRLSPRQGRLAVGIGMLR
jgi:hypothetical protein